MSRKPCSLKLRAADSSTLLERVAGTVIVPGKRMCAGRRVDAAFGHIGDHRRDQRVAERQRDLARRAPCARTLCLPSAMCGPFCSVPPIGTRIVVLPARIASRSSGEVRSSRQTRGCACAERQRRAESRTTQRGAARRSHGAHLTRRARPSRAYRVKACADASSDARSRG